MKATGKYTYFKVSAALYIILYLLLNASFVHTHSIDGEDITHSHPFTGKHHTSNEASLIKFLNSSVGVSTSDVALPDCIIVFYAPVKFIYKNFYSCFSFDFHSLRAPPAQVF